MAVSSRLGPAGSLYRASFLMSALEKKQNIPTTLPSGWGYQRWRLIKDKLAQHGVMIGGIGVIIALVMIFFYLLYVILPLFTVASLEEAGHYAVPEPHLGATYALAIEEQNKIAVRFTDTGKAVFFDTQTGKVLLVQGAAIPEGEKITSFAVANPVNKGAVGYALSNGRVVVVRPVYRVSFPDGARVITPELTHPMGEEAVAITASDRAIEKIALAFDEDALTLAAKIGDKIHIVGLAQERSLFAEETSFERTESQISVPIEGLDFMLIDKTGRSLYLASKTGRLAFYDITDKSNPSLKQALNTVEAGRTITSMVFLNGDLSVMVGDSGGTVSQWSAVRAENGRPRLEKFRSFEVSNRPVTQLAIEQRRKGFVSVDDQGGLGIFHTTAEKTLLNKKVEANIRHVTVSPRANSLLVQTGNDKFNFWTVHNEHPEVSLKSLWQEVWYESYPEPELVWQTSAATSDFEPKFSLTVLVFGTFKAAFYAMLVAVPLALMGAIYTAYFMAAPMRQYVKPTIEIMGALPTVILGFLAGLWLAPFMEANLAGVFSFLLFMPAIVMLFALGWQFLPKAFLEKFPEGWDAALLVPVIVAGAWLSFAVSVPLEIWLFDGSLRDWLRISFGLDYDQRNAMVVAVAMGFAVIPSIFSIAEDAIFSVPKHLTVGSLALGATPWQTMSKVILLTASPGIFSAVMIGFGRAVGETMIVLMATGNTPVMDLSIFQGMRTLAATIAVEMPESAVDSTHYRVLFLAALILFIFTFIFNTLAEIVRQRLREKYSSL